MAEARYTGRRVALLVGGLSSEREVSLSTGAALHGALRERGYEVVVIDPTRALPSQLHVAGAEVVFIGLHGTYGEDGRLQGLLDWLGLPYTGSGLRGSQLAFDKVLAKRLVADAGVPVAADVVYGGEARPALESLPFGLPVVVKPVADGSSVGVTIVHEAADFRAALEQASAGRQILIERFVEGPEVSVVLLGDTCLGSVEIEPARDFYDYEAKYGVAGTRYHVPPRLPAEQIAAIEAHGVAAQRALGCSGVCRADFMLGAEGPIFLELNTLPGMTATSLVPKVAARAGIDFPELVERILDLAECGGPEVADSTLSRREGSNG